MAFVTVSASRNPVIDGLLYGTKWTDQTVSYSFPDTADELTDYSEPLDPLNFRSLDASERLLVQTVLASWSSVADIRFTEAPNAGARYGSIITTTCPTLLREALAGPQGPLKPGTSSWALSWTMPMETMAVGRPLRSFTNSAMRWA